MLLFKQKGGKFTKKYQKSSKTPHLPIDKAFPPIRNRHRKTQNRYRKSRNRHRKNWNQHQIFLKLYYFLLDRTKQKKAPVPLK